MQSHVKMRSVLLVVSVHFLKLIAGLANSNSYHLVAFNVGKLKAPLGDKQVAEFEKALGPINDLALISEGFVWQLNMEPHERQNTGIKILDDDPLLMPQLSLWTDASLLTHYVVKSGHGMYLKRRKEWFDKLPEPYGVCYWRPSECNDPPMTFLKDAFDRLEWLKFHGSSPRAFHFREVMKYANPYNYEADSL